MALLQTFLTLATRWAGRILNTVFGWATTMVFGKVREERQVYLSLIAFASVAWMIALLGILLPGVATFLIAFIPLTNWATEQRVRIGMLVAAVLLPLLIGFLSLYLFDPAERPKGLAAKTKIVLTGYPYTLGLSLSFLMMLVFAPMLKIRMMLRGWSTQYIPMVVDAPDYEEVVEEIQEALQVSGWETTRGEPSWMIRLPTLVLARLTGGSIENLLADQLTTLESDDLSLVLHPSNLMLSGKQQDVTRARTVIVQQLAFSKAYMTWTKEGNELEDRLEALWQEMRASPSAVRDEAFEALRSIEEAMDDTELSYEEWEVLFRDKLLVERGLLRETAGLTERLEEPTDTDEP